MKILDTARPLFLNFSKAIVKVSTNYPDYYRYLSSYFEKIILSESPYFDLEIKANWQKGSLNKHLSKIKVKGYFSKIGGNTLLSGNRVATIKKIEARKKVLFDIEVKDNKYYVNNIVNHKGFKDTIRYKIFKKPQEGLFFSLTYPMLYYPMFFRLERSLATHILHASAFMLDKSCAIVCGLEGIGKTTLALSLIKKAEDFLSDNLVFYDKESVYSCYELLRLAQGDFDSVGVGKVERLDNFKVGKDFCRPLSTKTSGVKPDIFIFPSFSDNFFIKKVAQDEAVMKAILLSQIPAELRSYAEYSRICNLLDCKFNVYDSRFSALKSLLSSVPCFEVGMVKSEGLSKNAQKIKELIADAKQ
jgi:hypothetical protein